MLEVLTDTDRRLVLRVGQLQSRATKIILDKNAGRAWFDRRLSFFPQKTFSLLLAEFATVSAVTTTSGKHETDYLQITTRSGGRLRFASGPGETDLAAERVRDFVGLPQHMPHMTEAVRPIEHWRQRIASSASKGAAILAIAAVAIGVVWSVGGVLTSAVGAVGNLAQRATDGVGGLFAPPDCNTPESVRTIQELVRDRLGSSAVISEVVQTGSADGERLCSAVARGNNRTANVSYRVEREGRAAKVHLAAISIARLDANRMSAVARAAETFLAVSRHASTTGAPPRQNDSAIDPLLATLFGVSDLAAEPLPGNEVDDAMRWLRIGDRIGAVYLLAGTGFEDFARVPHTERTQQQMRANVVAFSGEIGRYLDFQLTLLGAIANAQMRVTATDSPVARDDTRALLSQAMRSSFIALVYGGLSDSWRMNRLTTLARTAPVAARFLSKDEARAVREQALQTVDYFKEPMVRERVREIAQAIAPR